MTYLAVAAMDCCSAIDEMPRDMAAALRKNNIDINDIANVAATHALTSFPCGDSDRGALRWLRRQSLRKKQQRDVEQQVQQTFGVRQQDGVYGFAILGTIILAAIAWVVERCLDWLWSKWKDRHPTVMNALVCAI